MRLWHRELIPYLPKEMLVSQWRECIAIKRQWEKGTLKHRLVSYVMEHSKEYFMEYSWQLTQELLKRNIKYKQKYYNEILEFCDNDIDYESEVTLYYPEHNDRYLAQCYFNLQEKYDRGIVSEEDWKNIHKNIYGLIKEK